MASTQDQIRASIVGLVDAYKASPPKAEKNHTPECDDSDDGDNEATPDELSQSFKLFVPIVKSSDERQEITGEVLVPEQVDAHGDIISAEVIEKAAGDFLAGFNHSTKLGYMHKDFTKRFELRQSYIAPSDLAIASRIVKAGTWVMVVKVLDAKVWKSVKDGKLTGFSIGGKAKVEDLTEE